MSGTDFYYENMVRAGREAGQLAPGDVPRRVYFGNSGAEAIEAAMKMARYSTGRQQFIAFFGSFHGRTLGALSLTGSKGVQKQGFSPLIPGVHHVPYPNCYRCPFGQTPSNAAVECIKHIEDVVIRHIVPADEIAAIFVEPVQGEGGYVVPPQKFFDELQALAQRHRILLVFDEVQAAWAEPARCSRPSISMRCPTSSRSRRGSRAACRFGDGRARRCDEWPPGAHASTFGGNPVCDRRRAGNDRTAGAGADGQRRAHGSAHHGPHARLAGAVPDRRATYAASA